MVTFGDSASKAFARSAAATCAPERTLAETFQFDGAGMWLLATALVAGHGDVGLAPDSPAQVPVPAATDLSTQGRGSGSIAGAAVPAWPCPSGPSSPPLSYEAYIRSDAWRRSPARLGELKAAGGRCRLCGRGPREVTIEVHHNTYERLGREEPRDLCAICRDCHRVVTCEIRHRRFAAMALPPLRDTPRLLAGRVLSQEDRE